MPTYASSDGVFFVRLEVLLFELFVALFVLVADSLASPFVFAALVVVERLRVAGFAVASWGAPVGFDALFVVAVVFALVDRLRGAIAVEVSVASGPGSGIGSGVTSGGV